jgi:3-hydroxyisobutyrate dehydrogenase-like beta-hydroxyacid dehydrogenase
VPEPTTVGVIGLGAMGTRIVGRLGGAGYDLVVWNRTPGKAAALPAREVATPAEAAAEADAVIVMVSDPAALEAVTDGPAGIAAGASDSTTVIQMSTVGVAATARLAAALPSDTGLLDAPVLGSIGETESGALTIFVGGSAPLFERWTPLLLTLGTPVYVGPVGAGSAAKLVANTTLVGTIGVLGEAIAVGRSLGLPNDAVFSVLGSTPLAEQARRRRPAIVAHEYPRRFGLSLARKDADLILHAAEKAGVELRLAAAARDWLADAEAAGHGEEDYSAVLEQIIET